jgi:hypothetical protein
MVEQVEEGCLEGEEEDRLKLLRIRTVKHELIITPGKLPFLLSLFGENRC